MTKRFMVVGAFAAAILLIAPAKGNAQSFAVDHFTRGAAQSYDFVNYGLNGASETPGAPAAGWECVNAYVYSAEEIVACGACTTSPNGSVHISLANLINNPITGVVPARGVIKFVYSAGPVCNAATATPRAGLKTFRTLGTSELELADGLGLSAAELARLHSDCTAVQDVGSGGPGITSCGPSD